MDNQKDCKCVNIYLGLDPDGIYNPPVCSGSVLGSSLTLSRIPTHRDAQDSNQMLKVLSGDQCLY